MILALAARRMLAQGGRLALRGVPDLSLELSDEAVNGLPRSFSDAHQGAAHMARLLFHRTPWPFWLVARDFARHWGTPTVQRILEDARKGSDRSLGMELLTDIHVPVLVVWGSRPSPGGPCRTSCAAFDGIFPLPQCVFDRGQCRRYLRRPSRRALAQEHRPSSRRPDPLRRSRARAG